MLPIAFVDLETTGTTATLDRITEIGIVELSETGVTEWSQLLNPDTRIPDFIVRLTGISNDMVRHAPGFADIAQDLLQRLQGRLFVAHNARFDHGFLKAEFRRVGLDLRVPVLCSVKLSRLLFPDQRGHGLDALVARHGLRVAERHRALGDAQLIHQFWTLLQRDPGPQALDAAVTRLLARPSLPPHLDEAMIDALPQGHGVYLFYGENELPLYVGKSIHLRKRVLSHFAADHRSAADMALSQQVRRIDWRETEGELGSLLLESALVKQLLPTHNRQLRRNRELCVWRMVEHEGSPRPELTWARDLPRGAHEDLYGLFRSERAAIKALREMADEAGLCHALLGLERREPGKPCFAAQLGRCHGACIGRESSALHGARLAVAMSGLRLARWPHPGPIGVREGDTLHVIDAWCHLGTARSDEELHELLAHGRPVLDMDAYQILRRLLPKAKLVQLPQPGRAGPRSDRL